MEKKRFTFETSLVNQIIVVDASKCWIKTHDSGVVSLVSTDGHKVKNVSCSCFRLIAKEENEIIFTDYMRKTINKLDVPEHREYPLVSTAPRHPSLICWSQDNTFFVVTEGYGGDLNSTDRVEQYSTNAELLQSFKVPEELLSGGQTIVDITENINGDLCLVLRGDLSSCKNSVALINEDTMKVNYQGQNTEKPFDPLGICHDRQGNIFVSDNQNHCIHLLSAEGEFQEFLFVPVINFNFPGPLAYLPDNNNLFIGWDKCCITVLDLNN